MRILICAILLASAARAQVASASLAGTVTDESGGAVTGVAITAAQNGSDLSRSVVTGPRGEFAFAELAPGAYSVTARKPGFKTYEAEGIALGVGQASSYDIRLAVGEVQDRVTVAGEVSPTQTQSAALSYEMDSARIASLPLATRNIVAFATLGPGAIPRQLGGFVHDVVNDIQEGSRGAVALNPPINGGRSTMNSFLLDGAYDTDRNTFAIAVYPPLEAVQEFRMQSSLAPAEFPQSGGGAMDVVTKSGTQEIHGSALEYFQNEAADARNYFDDPALPRPIFRQNQFGGAVGGPLPWAKTYFHASYEGLRKKAGTSALSIVPDAATRAGDFGSGSAIFDPLSAERAPFPENRIPSERISPVSSAYLARFQPLPNRAGDGGNYLDSTPNENVGDSASGRIDRQFGDNGRLFGRYTFNRERNLIAGSFPALPASERVRAQQAALAYQRNGARWINDTRLSFTRLRVFNVPESAFGANVARELGIVDAPNDPFTYGLPYFLVTNYSMVTDLPTLPQTQRDNLWHASDTFSLQRRNHTLKFGADILRFDLNYLQTSQARGQYTFTGVFTSADGSGVGSGDPFADFLLGYPQNTTRTAGSGQAYLRQTGYAGFIQDEWRVTPSLTLNLGLRYEYASPYTEARQNLLNLDYSALPQPPRLVRADSAVRPDRNNFAPRAGLAWRLPGPLRAGGETVFRAGYGIYYTQEIAVETYDLILNGLSNQVNQTQGDRLPVLTIANGFPRTSSTGLPSYFGVDPNARTPYVQQWNAGIQHAFGRNLTLEIAYAGSKGTKLGRFRQFNTPAHVETGENLPPREGDLQSLRTFPELGRIIQRQHIANSIYHSLQVKAEQRMSRRLSLLASFVWSKSIDDADSVIPGLFDSVGAQDERNLRLERGLSFFNVGRRISGGWVYRLPGPRLLGAAGRDWTLSGILTLQDGTPLNPFYFALDFANSGTPNRPDVVPGQPVTLPRSQRTADHFFNTAAFTAPQPLHFGNAGRNTIPGPGNNIVDLALSRRFPVAERRAIDFRAESFNTLNHPNWGIPGPYPDFGPFFGKIFSTGDPRRMQFALRFEF